MTIIHMEADLVNDQGRQITYAATNFLDALDRLRYSAEDLRQAWDSPRKTNFMRDLDRLIGTLRSQSMTLDALGKSVLREVDEWIDVDRTESAYITAVKNSFSISKDDILSLGSAIGLASTLRWSPLRPNSIIFTGPNWMRKAVGIKEMTRIIKPTTLSKGMALAGLAESGLAASDAIKEDLADMRYEDASRTVSAATVDGGFRFALSAIGAVGIPLALGAIVAAVGLPVVAGGAVVLAGTVLLGLGYQKLVEAPVWEMWKQSAVRKDVIETGARTINQVSNYMQHLKEKAIERVGGAFNNFIQGVTVPAPA